MEERGAQTRLAPLAAAQGLSCLLAACALSNDSETTGSDTNVTFPPQKFCGKRGCKEMRGRRKERQRGEKTKKRSEMLMWSFNAHTHSHTHQLQIDTKTCLHTWTKLKYTHIL